MHIKKQQNLVSVLEAVDNLSSLAELNMQPEKDRQPQEFAEEQSGDHIAKLSWEDHRNFGLNVEKIRTTFKILYNYLKDIYDYSEEEFKELLVQKGIQAMINLVTEAGSNLEKYLQNFPEGKSMEKVTEWPEYKDLQQFYLNIVAPKIHNRLELEEKWQDEWGMGEGVDTKKGIWDIDGIRQDQDYELFLIRREDGRPFFGRTLLRHMHLVEQFDSLLVHPLDEDPLAKMSAIQDRDIQLAAKEILHSSAAYIDEFYRMGMKHKDTSLVATMNKAVMALLLTANPRNLLQASIGKSCRDYFRDFHYFFRILISSKEYQQFFISSPPTSERLAHCLINLSHALAAVFFMRESSMEEVRPVIRQLMESGKEGELVSSETKSPLSLWNNLLDEDELIRSSLKSSPYGPLKNAIAIFDKEKIWKGFDPLFQGNPPHSLFSAVSDALDIGFIHLPCPTLQTHINKAEITPEFDLFIRALSSGKRNQRHLLFNVQDRTAWKEHARSTALEEMQKKSEFEGALSVVTLATGTDFYFQSGSFRDADDAKDFKNQLKEQVEEGGQCGFSFPESVELSRFTADAIETIHTLFFDGKKTLSRKNRLDFIEIFYLYLILKCVEQLRPDTVSFTSKDGLDASSALNAEIFAFLKMMNSKNAWTEEEKEYVRCLLYAPALLIRQRAIKAQNLKRAVSALAVINAELEAHFNEVVKSSSALFRTSFFHDLRVDWRT